MFIMWFNIVQYVSMLFYVLMFSVGFNDFWWFQMVLDCCTYDCLRFLYVVADVLCCLFIVFNSCVYVFVVFGKCSLMFADVSTMFDVVCYNVWCFASVWCCCYNVCVDTCMKSGG